MLITLTLLQSHAFMSNNPVGSRIRCMVVISLRRMVLLMNGHRCGMMRSLKVVRMSKMKRQNKQLSDINTNSQYAKQLVLFRILWRL